MATLLPTGGFQLPFQRRLSRLYNDTKKSSDFVQKPIASEKQQDDPDIKALHRRLRIQKDRLVSWGLEWSDPSNQAAEIDESLSQAGLSEVVGSIMSTIKDILAEAEQLWLSGSAATTTATTTTTSTGGAAASTEKKAPLVQWDRARFEGLITDFTASVDTLYDLSRTRGAAMRRTTKKGQYNSNKSLDEVKPFESTRIKTPQVIDPSQLTEIAAAHDGLLPSGAATQRAVVLMSKTSYSEMAHGRTREPWGPLLLEYATFDSIYSTTGIMPPMSRFEKLSDALQQDSQRAPGAWTGLPRLLGYFEDMENSRFGIVYRFPAPFDAAIIESYKSSAAHEVTSLRALLAQPHMEPPLEAKFRLAYNLANTVFDMHARGVTHGKLNEDTILLSNATKKEDNVAPSETVDVRRPLVSSFDVFSEDKADGVLDPRHASPSQLGAKGRDERVLELYALSMILLSIGLWTTSFGRLPRGWDEYEANLKGALDMLRVRCGGLYAKAVHACLEAVDLEMAGGAGTGEALLSQVQMRVSRFLETCCILDGVSDLEQRLKTDMADEAAQREESAKAAAGDFKTKTQVASAVPFNNISPQVQSALQMQTPTMESEAPVQPIRKEPKLKLYPQVPLPAEAVEKWNTILMPQINQALRHFYRKHPESVEISLESVGMSPQQTEPTVLVVCSSVGKVRAILNKRVGDLFDGSTGFALKVCRGHVLRSRRQQAGHVYRSMADEDEVEAVNPKYQERPCNGASIGAWIGDRHLPPVSFGGLVIVDDKTYGMTVHHMLDDPDRDFGQEETRRSAAIPGLDGYTETQQQQFDSTEEEDEDEDEEGYELSDTESEPYSETDITSEYGDESEDEDEGDFEEPGDIPGIEPGCGDGYVVTQPALDDVEDGFYPSAETEDEDHLDTFSLGEVYASSGIRRKEANGLIHEVDWALFEFGDGRLPDDNTMPVADDDDDDSSTTHGQGIGSGALQPTTVAPSSALPGMAVQCVARTSGLQRGHILPALCSVKIYGRVSPSHTYQVASPPSRRADVAAAAAGGGSLITTSGKQRHMAMGIPGDSGAWVVGSDGGELCGHVLAWSQRKRVAYICPMDVLLLDIAQTLDALEVRLPGGEAVVVMEQQQKDVMKGKTADSEDEWNELGEDEEEKREREEEAGEDGEDGEDDERKEVPPLVQKSTEDRRVVTPLAGELSRLAAGVRDLNMGVGVVGHGINVSS